MIEWDAPVALAADALVHFSTCRRATITELQSGLYGEPNLFVVSLSSDPARVHPTLPSLDEAKEYVEGLLGATQRHGEGSERK